MILLSWEGVQQRIADANYEIFFCHPEEFLSCNESPKIFQSCTYCVAVKAVIVDEVHLHP